MRSAGAFRRCEAPAGKDAEHDGGGDEPQERDAQTDGWGSELAAPGLKDSGHQVVFRDVVNPASPPGDTDALFRLYALLALVKGAAVDARDVHNAWAAWMQERDPDHRSIKPFDELDAETQAADEPFVRAIRAVVDGRRPDSAEPR